MPTGQIPDPFLNFNFLVELDGITRAAFQECTLADATTEVVEYREGGEITTTRKLPGMTKYGNITLKWGMTDDTELYDWHRQTVQGNLERKNGSIILLNRLGEEVARWNFVRAWITKYDAPDMNASQSAIAVEMVEIVHEGMERVV
ncbi:MAG TPA: phage tail protein [Aggregatilineales bacterium]|nr:phage tail protein [Chloroflexota bacterium]HOA24212.1 phage tail protein [Aggregatilineales bacterium]HPV06838.1 phage tail protein [Aggregatilineales bacterium]HQA66755.1 phage tail protein [Aggregatilineales bacterium]HQE16947.1 phage tail protein [Aggregatilineales bacterium]